VWASQQNKALYKVHHSLQLLARLGCLKKEKIFSYKQKILFIVLYALISMGLTNCAK